MFLPFQIWRLRKNHRAQTEIDAAIGEDRSPQWSDFSKLPYINMIIKESHRWRPVSPLGVPHALAEGPSIIHSLFPYLLIAH